MDIIDNEELLNKSISECHPSDRPDYVQHLMHLRLQQVYSNNKKEDVEHVKMEKLIIKKRNVVSPPNNTIHETNNVTDSELLSALMLKEHRDRYDNVLINSLSTK